MNDEKFERAMALLRRHHYRDVADYIEDEVNP